METTTTQGAPLGSGERNRRGLLRAGRRDAARSIACARPRRTRAAARPPPSTRAPRSISVAPCAQPTAAAEARGHRARSDSSSAAAAGAAERARTSRAPLGAELMIRMGWVEAQTVLEHWLLRARGLEPQHPRLQFLYLRYPKTVETAPGRCNGKLGIQGACSWRRHWARQVRRATPDPPGHAIRLQDQVLNRGGSDPSRGARLRMSRMSTTSGPVRRRGGGYVIRSPRSTNATGTAGCRRTPYRDGQGSHEEADDLTQETYLPRALADTARAKARCRSGRLHRTATNTRLSGTS